MLTKILIVSLFVLPAVAANNDDEIIKNLEFFQSMEMLKEEVAFVSNAQVSPLPLSEKEKTKEKAPEKKQ